MIKVGGFTLAVDSLDWPYGAPVAGGSGLSAAALSSLWAAFLADRDPVDRSVLLGHYEPFRDDVTGRLQTVSPDPTWQVGAKACVRFGLATALDAAGPDEAADFEWSVLKAVRLSVLETFRVPTVVSLVREPAEGPFLADLESYQEWSRPAGVPAV